MKKKVTLRLHHFLGIIFFLFLAAGMSHAWINFNITQLGYKLSRLKQEMLEVEEYNQKLRLEMAYLKSPEYLEEEALNRAGLRSPSPEQIIFLR